MGEDQRIDGLTPEQISALLGAGAWYAKYHATIIAERADDGSAYAVAQRERYRDLVAGLRQLGVKVPEPSGLADSKQSRAA